MIGCHISSHANCYQTLQSIYAILTYKKKSWKFLGWTSGILLRFFLSSTDSLFSHEVEPRWKDCVDLVQLS